MNKEKYVDESWKEQASEERDQLADGETTQKEPEKATASKPEHPGMDSSGTEDVHDFEVNFLNYVTSLGFQAMIFMGEIPHPVTNQTEENLAQAKFLIDTLVMLKEKTAGNLNGQESSILESSIYELQMKYVQKTQSEGA